MVPVPAPLAVTVGAVVVDAAGNAFGLSGDTIAFVGAILAAIVAAIIGRNSNKDKPHSASAEQLDSLGARLDAQQEQINRLMNRERAWINFVSALLRHIAKHGDGTPPPDSPPELNM